MAVRKVARKQKASDRIAWKNRSVKSSEAATVLAIVSRRPTLPVGRVIAMLMAGVEPCAEVGFESLVQIQIQVREVTKAQVVKTKALGAGDNDAVGAAVTPVVTRKKQQFAADAPLHLQRHGAHALKSLRIMAKISSVREIKAGKSLHI